MNQHDIRMRCFIKFMDPQYVHSFINDGLLYMNTLEFFRSYEEEDESLRADQYEGLVASYDPKNVEMTLAKNGTVIEPIGKIDIYQPLEDAINLYCVAMITDAELTNPFLLDKRFEKFGSKAVVIEGSRINTFLERLSNAIDADTSLGSIYSNGKFSGYVSYVHRNSHLPYLDAFNKFNDYSWQKEFRIVLGRETGSGALPLKIGNLSDIAYVTDTKDIVKTLCKLGHRL